ncbi:16765_t:CDS:1, partial [Acaulospora morrowiae]
KAISTAVLDDFDTTATLGVSDSATAEFHSDNLPSPSLRSTVVTSNTVAMTVATKTTPGSENITSIRQSDKKPRYGFLSSLLNNNSSSLSLSSTASGSDTSNKKQESGSKYKLFKPWGNPQDSEYKAIEKALM